MEISYQEYSVEAVETSPGRWRAYIRRTDGHHIKTHAGVVTNQIPAPGGLEEFSAQAAIIAAKKLIDRGDLSRAREEDE